MTSIVRTDDEFFLALNSLAFETRKTMAKFSVWSIPERGATRLTISWLSKTGQWYELSELIDSRLIVDSENKYQIFLDAARSLSSRCRATPDPESLYAAYAATGASIQLPIGIANTQMSSWLFTQEFDEANIGSERVPTIPDGPPKPEPLPEGCLAPRLPPSFDPLKPDGESLATAYIPRKTELANKYGVDQSTISNIITRKNWGHIP